AVLAFGAVWASWPQAAGATPIAAPTWTGPGSTGYFTITASYTDDTPVGSSTAVLNNIGGVGNFVAPGTVTPLADETISVTSSSVTVTEDSDTIPQTKTITVNFQCLTTGTATFTLSHGGTTSSTSAVLTCSPYYNGNYPQYPPYYGGY